MEDGRIGLIDFGQVKQISGRYRETLCKLMIAIDENDGSPIDYDKAGKLALELGVELNANARPEAPAAVGIWLFDGTVEELPGGYDKGELSPNSPVKELKSFPQDLVLVGRASILIKALSNRLNVPWSLAREWAPIARQVLDANFNYSNSATEGSSSGNSTILRVRFRDVVHTLKMWGKGRATRLMRRLPPSLRTKVANLVLKIEERKSRRALTNRRRRLDTREKTLSNTPQE